MNNKQLGRKLLEIETLLNALNGKPIQGTQLEAQPDHRLDDLIGKMDSLNTKLDNLTNLFKEILSLKNEQKPELTGLKFLWNKFFHSSDS